MLKNLKERILEELKALWGRILELQAAQDAIDRFSNLPPAAQKLTIVAGAFAFSYILLQLPMSFISSADEQLEQFKKDHETIREIYRIESYRPALAKLTALDPSSLQRSIEMQLDDKKLQQEQKLGMSSFDANAKEENPNPKFKSLDVQGVRVKLAKLNVNQILNIGKALNEYQGTKLLSLNIQASAENDHYFDVSYALAKFNVKSDPVKNDKDKKPGSRK